MFPVVIYIDASWKSKLEAITRYKFCWFIRLGKLVLLASP